MPVRHRTAARGLTAVAVARRRRVIAVLAPATAGAGRPAPALGDRPGGRRQAGLRSLAHDLGDDLAGLVIDAATGQVVWSQTPAEAQSRRPTPRSSRRSNALRLRPDLPVHHQGHDRPDAAARWCSSAAATRRCPRASSARGPHGRRGLPGPGRHAGCACRSTTRCSRRPPSRRLEVGLHVRGRLPGAGARRRPAPPLGHLPGRRRGLRPQAGEVGPARAQRRPRRPGRRARPCSPRASGLDLATTVRRDAADSDNDIAEGLHRLVALQTGFPADLGRRPGRAGGRARPARGHPGHRPVRRQRAVPAGPAVAPRPGGRAVARRSTRQHPNLAGCSSGSFAVAGVSGTLAPHFLRYVTNPTRCAAGLIQAKTGSLTGVISLSGFARGADGQVKVFSFLLNQVPSTLTTRRAVDRLATTVTGCW